MHRYANFTNATDTYYVDDDDGLSSGMTVLVVILVVIFVGALAVCGCLKVRQQRLEAARRAQEAEPLLK